MLFGALISPTDPISVLGILKEAKAFAVDLDSMAECTYLTKYFGPYHITKTTENRFIFSKSNESAVLSKYRW